MVVSQSIRFPSPVVCGAFQAPCLGFPMVSCDTLSHQTLAGLPSFADRCASLSQSFMHQ